MKVLTPVKVKVPVPVLIRLVVGVPVLEITPDEWRQALDVNLYCLKVNASGNPIHPLYVSYETEPVRFDP